MNASTQQLQALAETLAIEFKKVATENPKGLTDAWALFQARNAHGVFLTPAQALKVGKWARASLEVFETANGWIKKPVCPTCNKQVYAPDYGCRSCVGGRLLSDVLKK